MNKYEKNRKLAILLKDSDILMMELEKERDESLENIRFEGEEDLLIEYYKKTLASVYRMRNNAAALLLRNRCSCEVYENGAVITIYVDDRKCNFQSSAVKNILQSDFDKIIEKNKKEKSAVLFTGEDKTEEFAKTTQLNNYKKEIHVSKIAEQVEDNSNLQERRAEKAEVIPENNPIKKNNYNSSLDRDNHGSIKKGAQKVNLDQRTINPIKEEKLERKSRLTKDKENTVQIPPKKEEIDTPNPLLTQNDIDFINPINNKKKNNDEDSDLFSIFEDLFSDDEDEVNDVKQGEASIFETKSNAEPLQNPESKSSSAPSPVSEPAPDEEFSDLLFDDEDILDSDFDLFETEPEDELNKIEEPEADMSKSEELNVFLLNDEEDSEPEQVESEPVNEFDGKLYDSNLFTLNDDTDLFSLDYEPEKPVANESELNKSKKFNDIFSQKESEKEVPVTESTVPLFSIENTSLSPEEIMKKLKDSKNKRDQEELEAEIKKSSEVEIKGEVIFDMSTGETKKGVVDSKKELNRVDELADNVIHTSRQDKMMDAKINSDIRMKMEGYQIQKESDYIRKKNNFILDECFLKISLYDEDNGNLLKEEDVRLVVAPLTIPETGTAFSTDIVVFIENGEGTGLRAVEPGGKQTLSIKTEDYTIFIKGSWDKGNFITALSVLGSGNKAKYKIIKNKVRPENIKKAGIGHNVIYMDHIITAHIIPLMTSNNLYDGEYVDIAIVLIRNYGIDQDCETIYSNHNYELKIKGEKYKYSLTAKWEEDEFKIISTIN